MAFFILLGEKLQQLVFRASSCARCLILWGLSVQNYLHDNQGSSRIRDSSKNQWRTSCSSCR